MNKNSLFLVSMIVVSALLFLLRLTGIVPHIIVSLIGLAILILFTVKTRREWKKPALEGIMRGLYLVTVVTGGILMKVHGVTALGVAHKVGAVLFLALLLVLYIPRIREK